MLVEKFWTFEQTEPASTWEINNIPEGAIHPAIDRVNLSGGRIFNPDEDSQLVAPYGIQLSFGVTSEAGVAIGKYFVDEDTQTITTDSQNVTITVNQGGTAPTGATF